MKVATTKNASPSGLQTLFAFLVFGILCSSCQKEVTGDLGTTTDPITPTTPSSNVKVYTIESTSSTGAPESQAFNLTYDTNNRLISFISATSPGDKIIYKYNSDNTYTMDAYENNVASIHQLFHLNNIPLVDSTVQIDFGLKDTTTEKYIYNSSKQLATLKSYDYSKLTGSKLISTSNNTYDNNGNLIKVVSGSNITTYDYYLDLLNNLSIGMIYFQQSKNLVKTTTEANSVFTSMIINHTYTFDSSNRITSEKRVFNNKEIVVQKYSY